MAAQSQREQEVRDKFDAWSIGEASAHKGPHRPFGSAAVQKVRIEPVSVTAVRLNPDLWPNLSDEAEQAA